MAGDGNGRLAGADRRARLPSPSHRRLFASFACFFLNPKPCFLEGEVAAGQVIGSSGRLTEPRAQSPGGVWVRVIMDKYTMEYLGPPLSGLFAGKSF